ncbi:MAG: phosphatidate cytidylyltransferase [Tissierellia bacterium]|nr:phosphatidate cytidylyltransferase [Tissierellia bacterium]
MKKLITRTLSGILILSAVIFFTLKGDLYLLSSIVVLSSIASYEFHRAMKKIDLNYPLWLQLIFGLLLNIFAYLRMYEIFLLALTLIFLISFIIASLGFKYKLKDMMAFIFSIIYINVILSFILRFDSSIYLILVYCCAWGTDTFAYIAGALFGKHKLIERLSPNKTIEGSIGGILGSVLMVVLVLMPSGSYNLFQWALVAALGSIISQIGDLSASYVKRLAGIKDYGKIIVGHGGILDRFDSVIFAVPVIYMFNILIGR